MTEFGEQAVGRMHRAAADIRGAVASFEGGLTEADPDTGERWEMSQVMSHIVEFLPYWRDELARVVQRGGDETFGRVKSTPSRLERIESGRHDAPETQLRRMDDGVAEVATFIGSLSDEDLLLTGSHPARGAMTVKAAIQRFFVEHLEEHRDQLMPAAR
jgi:hypothetical protein